MLEGDVEMERKGYRSEPKIPW